ncbi:hypothetical protein ACQPW3_23530 [Actinosynnema sp. CA-248983]
MKPASQPLAKGPAPQAAPKPPAAGPVAPSPTGVRSQSFRWGEAAAQKESETARQYAPQRAARELQLQIARGQADYHDAISGKTPGQRPVQVVERVSENKTRVTDARTGKSVVHDMSLRDYVHPSNAVTGSMSRVVSGEVSNYRQSVQVDHWQKLPGNQRPDVSVGRTRDNRVVAVSRGKLPKDVQDRLKDGLVVDEGTLPDGRKITVFNPKTPVERNAEDLGRQWQETVKDGKVQPGELGQAVAGTAAITADTVVGLGESDLYGTGKDCLGSGKNCDDFRTEAAFTAVGVTPLKGAGLLRQAARGGTTLARTEQAAEKATRAARSLGSKASENVPTRAPEQVQARVPDHAAAPEPARVVDTVPARGPVSVDVPRTPPVRHAPDARPGTNTPPPRTTPGTRTTPDPSRHPVFKRAPEVVALGVASATQIPGKPERPREPGGGSQPEAPTTYEGEPRFDDPANPGTLADPEAPDMPRPGLGGDNPVTPERPTRPDTPREDTEDEPDRPRPGATEAQTDRENTENTENSANSDPALPNRDDGAPAARPTGDTAARPSDDTAAAQPNTGRNTPAAQPDGSPETAVEAIRRQVRPLDEALAQRPATLAGLTSDPQALAMVQDAVNALVNGNAQDITDRFTTTPDPSPALLTDHQSAVVQDINGFTGELRPADLLQQGFDPAWTTDPAARSRYLDQLYADSARTTPVLNGFAQAVVDELGVGRVKPRPAPKDRGRAEDKITEYKGEVSRLTDLAASSIRFATVDDVYRGLEAVLEATRRPGSPVRIVLMKDRFTHPQASGYRDILLRIQLDMGTDPSGKPRYHVGELRLQADPIEEISEYEHRAYEVRRDFEVLAKEARRSPHPEERALSALLETESRIRYTEAFIQAGGRPADPTINRREGR